MWKRVTNEGGKDWGISFSKASHFQLVNRRNPLMFISRITYVPQLRLNMNRQLIRRYNMIAAKIWQLFVLQRLPFILQPE